MSEILLDGVSVKAANRKCNHCTKPPTYEPTSGEVSKMWM